MNEPILSMTNISKSFSGVEVLHNIDLTLYRGEVHGVVGQNGAGKSTVMKILNGVYIKDSGTVNINGKVVGYNTPDGARKCGVSMIFQEFSLVPTLTVSQNIFLAKEPISKMLINDKECEKRTVEILESIGVEVDINPRNYVENLSIGSQQLVEISKALSTESKILIMDEPTASLTHAEIGSLFKAIRRLKEKGISIIYITHYLEDIFRICDRVTVLRDGNKIFTKGIKETDISEVISAMLGRTLKEKVNRKKREIDRNVTPILEVNNLKVGKFIKGISFKVWPGEILGIAGLLGSGRSEIVNAIFGITKKDKGDIIIGGKKINIKSSKDSIRAGISVVPEDKRKQGLILDFSIKENLILPIVNKLVKFFFINDREGKKVTENYINKLNIKAEGVWQIVKFLSGGNQQKIVVAKNMASSSKILLLDDPTFGIDIQSKQEIMNIITEFAGSGNGVVFISSELTEIVSYCNRILILKKGEVISTIDCKDDSDVSGEMLLKMVQ